MAVYLKPICRTIKYGNRGRDVMAVKLALKRAGHGRGIVMSNRAGSAFVYNLKRYQKAKGIHVDGQYGPKTHGVLKGQIAAIPYATWLWNNYKCPNTVKLSARSTIVSTALFGAAHAYSIHYTQSGLRMYGVRNRIKPPSIPRYEDCSSFSTWCYWVAKAPDPNGLGYNGYGYTGTLTRHGHLISTGSARPGDLVFYGGSYSVPTHVAVYIGGGRVVSHGSEYGPNIRSVYYRSVNHTRSYL